MQLAAGQNTENEVHVFIGRQPILDKGLNTFAYELLFRPMPGYEADFNDGEKATAQVINNALVEIGFDNLIGNNLAFINFTRDFLLKEVAFLLPPERVVLEILEDVTVDEELIRGVRQLREAGFTIALDDFEFHEESRPLIELADLIKYDVLALSAEEVAKQVALLGRKDIKLLAEKVETQEEFQIYKDMNFDYFQGYFFAKPALVTAKKLPEDRLALLNLLSRLQDQDIEIEEIEELVSQNISLSYKLFRYINSAAYALPKKIESIRQVVIYFGLQRLKNWTSLMAMTDVGGSSNELILTGLIRAKFCESLAKNLKRNDADSYFMLGLFSILDALMNTSMENILEKLPIADDVAAALLTHEGEFGAILKRVLVFEQEDWSDLATLEIEQELIHNLHLEAVTWARQAMSGLL